jgi:pyruvate/2-oxoglutarate dehydrogenase complex dihydrolipoamide acyltransferase (E2) component
MAEMILERLNVNDDEYVLRSWLVAEGSHVTPGTAIVEVETSKTAVEIEATEAGPITFLAGAGQVVKVGEPICRIGAAGATAVGAAPPPAAVTAQAPAPAPGMAAVAAGAPTMDASPRGFATKRPYRTDAAIEPARAKANGVARPSSVPMTHTGWADKRKAAEVANLSVVNPGGLVSCLIRGISVSRRSHPVGGLFADNISDLVIYECARLIARYPKLNAVYDADQGYRLAADVRFGYSVDVEDDLTVYNLGACETLTLDDIRSRIESCIEAHVMKKVPRALMAETTITLSDLSGSGLDSFVPLINGAQSCILGLSSPSPGLAKISLAFDHRVIGGLYVARFLDDLATRVQSHFRGRAEMACDICGQELSKLRALGERGLVRLVGPGGEDLKSCRNCYENW